MTWYKNPFHLYALASAVGCLITLSGCTVDTSKLPKEINPPLQGGSTRVANGGVIAIQFPMLATEAARKQLVEAYPCKYNDMIGHSQSSCGMMIRPGVFSGELAPQVFEQSTYYAAELKKIMSRYIDERQVRLEPQSIDYRDGRFTSTPILTDTSPAVLVLDLYVFQNGAVSGVGVGYMPRINVRTAGVVAPATCGNLLLADSHNQFDATKAQDCQKRDARNVPGFAPLQFFAERPPAHVDFPKRDKGAIGPDAVLVFKWLHEENRDDYLQLSAQPGYKATATSIDNRTADWIARISLDSLSRLDTRAAFDIGLVRYVASYDAGLAQRMANKQLAEGDPRLVSIMHKMLKAENDWLASQSNALAEGILNGEYGTSFRKERLLLAEGYDRGQRLTWMQAGATLAMGVSSGLMGGGVPYNPQMLMSQTLLSEQTFGNARSQLEQAVLQSVSPGIDMRTQVIQLSIEGISSNIQGSNQSEIHAQLQSIYDRLKGK
ncbi:hypothetical protein [Pseudomonas sp.]|uniref:hypothetical protein n=1 Tax=Pseudomonas sp. TaxID=306 RepID=UPI003D106AC6